ncbi:cytochrome P450, partial [Streptomyces sp. SID10244]|nr:cytochrome P450 [Streptomyces sp. SID10244]
HRCIGSNVARTVFKRMLVAVLDRMPDYRCDPQGAVHYDSIGVIQGMRHLPATFTPGPRTHSSLADTLVEVQKMVDDENLAEPLALSRAQQKG